MLSTPPYSLGMAGDDAQSGYYPGSAPISEDEIAKVSAAMAERSIGPENTRIRKVIKDGKTTLYLLQASTETPASSTDQIELVDGVYLLRGDHADELKKVCMALGKAKEYASNEKQKQYITHYIECFNTGSLEAFQSSMKGWVTDVAARVENIIGFIEPYCDPAGIRSEWEAMVGIADPEETSRLKRFVESSNIFIR